MDVCWDVFGEIVANYALHDSKKGYSVQPIAIAFEEGRYRYTQLERCGDIALYEQRHKDNPAVVYSEVIRIRVHPAHTWPSGQTTPAREAYPGASSWGRRGFTVYTRDQARELAAGLQG